MPDPVVISATVQEFLGQRYSLCGSYFQRSRQLGEKRLHRVVWIYHNGPVPENCDIHHVNGNRSDNRLENLSPMDKTEHQVLHNKGKEYTPWPAILAAPKWHGSRSGKKWHRGNYERNVASIWLSPVQKLCKRCGKKYSTVHSRATKSCFCSAACRAADFRSRHPGYSSKYR